MSELILFLFEYSLNLDLVEIKKCKNKKTWENQLSKIARRLKSMHNPNFLLKFLKYVLQGSKLGFIPGTLCMPALKCMHNFKYLVKFNIFDHFFWKRVGRNGRVETAVVVGIMQLIVSWKGRVLVHVLKGTTHSSET